MHRCSLTFWPVWRYAVSQVGSSQPTASVEGCSASHDNVIPRKNGCMPCRLPSTSYIYIHLYLHVSLHAITNSTRILMTISIAPIVCSSSPAPLPRPPNKHDERSATSTRKHREANPAPSTRQARRPRRTTPPDHHWRGHSAKQVWRMGWRARWFRGRRMPLGVTDESGRTQRFQPS